MNDKETLSFRTNKTKKKALDSVAKLIARDRSFIINEAIDNYLELHEWQINHIYEGVKQVEKGQSVSKDRITKILKKFRNK